MVPLQRNFKATPWLRLDGRAGFARRQAGRVSSSISLPDLAGFGGLGVAPRKRRAHGEVLCKTGTTPALTTASRFRPKSKSDRMPR
jgi:hypothetical protein